MPTRSLRSNTGEAAKQAALAALDPKNKQKATEDPEEDEDEDDAAAMDPRRQITSNRWTSHDSAAPKKKGRPSKKEIQERMARSATPGQSIVLIFFSSKLISIFLLSSPHSTHSPSSRP
jgi:hypothetical protein